LAKGGVPTDERYYRLADISKVMKNSVVMKNAYQVCLHSKNYTESHSSSFQGQKLKSYVYLN
jgi:hypothetical protein